MEDGLLNDWIREDDSDDETDDSHMQQMLQASSSASSHMNDQCFVHKRLSPLEALSNELSAHIFRHLSVQEICSSLALVSKSIRQATKSSGLWKIKFQSRWNFEPEVPESADWMAAYIQGYNNPHDLWITHWNCVYPDDCLDPGRTCIHIEPEFPPSHIDRDSTGGMPTEPQHLCPPCRYRQNPTALTPLSPVTSRAQAIAAATSLRLQESAHGQGDIERYSWKRAFRAFATAATLHRTIDARQFKAKGLHFMTDLLFFQVHSTPDELEELKTLFPDPSKQHLGHVAMHSWHLVHFTNPDFNRPIVWKTSLQRPDCFTVFPSEGYLRPGESQVVVFGVKPFASLLAVATHQLNAHREGVNEFWANVYTEEAHLPAAPFLIQYNFAAVVPCRRDADVTLGSAYPNHAQQHRQPVRVPTDGNRRTSDTEEGIAQGSPWQQIAQPNQLVRTLSLSAHVNANYPLNEFVRTTLVPFSIHDSKRAIVYSAPQLMNHFPDVWRWLENTSLETVQTSKGESYRTEKGCTFCHKRWGPRLEEVGQAYVLKRLDCYREKFKRDKKFQQTVELLRYVNAKYQAAGTSQEAIDRVRQILFRVHEFLVNFRGSSWLGKKQIRTILRWEIFVDAMYAKLDGVEQASLGEVALPWRHAGVYRHQLCTDSAFYSTSRYHNSDSYADGPGLSSGSTSDVVAWKDEQTYLRAFAHLAHSPGRFCLGPQEDPNHLQKYDSTNKFARRQKAFTTDIFMDDPVSAMQSALCILQDPRSLLAHGIFDRVPYPGTLFRRPTIPNLEPLKAPNMPLLWNIGDDQDDSIRSLIYYEHQMSLDISTLILLNGIADKMSTEAHVRTSYDKFVENLPPPGSGRFPLTTFASAEKAKLDTHADNDNDTAPTVNPSGQVIELKLPVGDLKGNDLNLPLHSYRSRFRGRQAQNPNNPPPPQLIGRGPRALNLLWTISAHLGWAVDDNKGASAVYVDRRILIGAQWLSISLMSLPLLWTLLARYAEIIPTTPLDYPLEALPFTPQVKMRFLSKQECLGFSFGLLLQWLILGRWIERYTSRDYFRAMLEHVDTRNNEPPPSRLARTRARLVCFLQRRWDALCPLFLQRLTFTPHWNRRTEKELIKHVAYWRSLCGRDNVTSFKAAAGRGLIFFDTQESQIDTGEESSSRKLMVGALVTLGSFSASTPHFVLNVLTVFAGSISFGLSMSLQSMETCREAIRVSNTQSILKTLNLVNVVILAFLIGNLVGSSGGAMFLAEFIVTAVSFMLGGAGTISASAMESWGTFFCLSATCFWGYLFGRVAVMEGIREKRSGFSSVMLCTSLAMMLVIWGFVLFVWDWDSPPSLMIMRHRRK